MSQTSERGAIAVVVAILMVALIGFAAIGVDVANLASDKQQLQNGADAGAFAIAESCSQGNCGDYNTVAQVLAQHNKNDGQVAQTSVALKMAEQRVTVAASDATEHWFARIWTSSSTVTADATVSWKNSLTGTASLPLALDTGYLSCLVGGAGSVFADGSASSIFIDKGGFYELKVPSSEMVKIYLADWANKTPPKKPVSGCELDGNWTPGGFGWLLTGGKVCEAETAIGQPAPVSTGVAPPNGCKSGTLADMIGKPVPLPVFLGAEAYGSGAGGAYTIVGYVAFVLDGYHVPTGSHLAPGFTDAKDMCKTPSSSANENCLLGHFTTVAILQGSGSTGGVDSGVHLIKLED